MSPIGIYQSWNNIKNHTDLFLFWQQEADLRTSLRQEGNFWAGKCDGDGLDLLMRSLYFGGQRQNFLAGLMASLTSTPALQWLKNAPPWLKSEFMTFVSHYLSCNEVEPQSLQFLVHLYDSALDSDYDCVIAALNIKQCRFLASKTANAALRTLLKNREQEILTGRNDEFYGLLADLPLDTSRDFPLGKAELCQAALAKVVEAGASIQDQPHSGLQLMLEMSDLLFRCGLFADAGLLLKSWLHEHQISPLTMLETSIRERLIRLQNKLIGTAVILTLDYDLNGQARELLHTYDAALNLHPRLDALLTMYEFVLEAGWTANTTPWEAIYYYNSARQWFPSDARPPQVDHRVSLDLTEALRLIQVSQGLLSSLPHESFMLLEFTRLMLLRSHIMLEPGSNLDILNSYIQLWNWIPSSRFINPSLVSQLSAYADPSSRQDAERILAVMDSSASAEKLLPQLHSRPDLFRNKKDPWRNQILLGYVLGVLA